MKNYFIIIGFCLTSLFSCNSNQTNELPIKHNKHKSNIEIPFREDGGTKYVQVKVNGISLEAIFDTGCEFGISMSMLELDILAKNGTIAQYDILGTTTASIADGSQVETMKVRLHKVELGENLILEDVIASVDFNMDAPVLLGTAVLDNVSNSYKIDNDKHVIEFSKK